MNDVEQSAARFVQGGRETTRQNILQKQPPDHAEVFEPSSTTPSRPRTMFCSAALQASRMNPCNQSEMSKLALHLLKYQGYRGDVLPIPQGRRQFWKNVRWTPPPLTGLREAYAGLCSSRQISCQQGPANNVDRCEGDVETYSQL
jgi:hypothetical protein